MDRWSCTLSFWSSSNLNYFSNSGDLALPVNKQFRNKVYFVCGLNEYKWNLQKLNGSVV